VLFFFCVSVNYCKEFFWRRDLYLRDREFECLRKKKVAILKERFVEDEDRLAQGF